MTTPSHHDYLRANANRGLTPLAKNALTIALAASAGGREVTINDLSAALFTSKSSTRRVIDLLQEQGFITISKRGPWGKNFISPNLDALRGD